jgi:hypothetical protein
MDPRTLSILAFRRRRAAAVAMAAIMAARDQGGWMMDRSWPARTDSQRLKWFRQLGQK